MSFINMKEVAVSQALKTAHYPFPRKQDLHDALSWCMTDYYAKAVSGRRFEARGILVTGESRVGKTTELNRLLSEANAAQVPMPDGRPARFVTCLLSGKVSWKDLGLKTAEALGYRIEARRTQSYIWSRVLHQAKKQGVIGIHFDECQHVFGKGKEETNRLFLDSFKTLLKEPEWPLILILSGIPALSDHVSREPQLAHLLRPIHLGLIDLDRDLDELNTLAFTLAEAAEVEFDHLSTQDFYERLCFATAGRWGLVIELFIDAFTRCRRSERKVCTVEDFVAALAATTGLPPGFSPFTMPDYTESFDSTALLLRQNRRDRSQA